MATELQRIVDALALRVGRPALIEDRRQRVIVYSEHADPVDEVRQLSILQRHTTPEVTAFLRRAGIMSSRAPVRTPGSDERHLLPRVCIPIWHRDLLLGFVWFIDADRSMTADEIDAATVVAGDLALALYRENLAGELAAQRETESVRMLLADEAEAREHAARALVEDGALVVGEATVAICGRLVIRPGVARDDLMGMALEQALSGTHRWIGARHAVHLVRYDHGVLVVSCPSARRPGAEQVAEHLYAALEAATRGLDGVASVVAGVGQPVGSLPDARRSYDEALQAAAVAAQLPALGRVAYWSQLGIYRVLFQLSEDQISSASIHPGLERLLEDPSLLPLLETIEAYLDLAGNAHATADRMMLHRTSLYYRLQRIEKLAGTDLKDGNERLCLHLALKLARLNGRYRPGTRVHGPGPTAPSTDIERNLVAQHPTLVRSGLVVSGK